MRTLPNFDYRIIERYGVISTAGAVTKELNLISYNGASPKFDLRSWETAEDGRKMRKGITFSATELDTLRDILNGIELDPIEEEETEGKFIVKPFFSPAEF